MKIKKINPKKFLIGTSGWIYEAWKGYFYPTSLPKKEWFNFYQHHFNIVELNATFYRQFDLKVYKKWHDQALPKFQYILKVPRYITHIKLLKNCKTEIKKFCKRASTLKNHGNLLLLQLPPRMKCNLPRLEKALSAFDDPTKVVVEFRNKTWLTHETKQLLTKMGAIFCIIDCPGIPRKNWLTAKVAYIRLHGHTRWYNYNYSEAELNKFASLSKKLVRLGAEKVYILFNNDYFSYASQNARYLQNKLNKSK